MDFSGTVKQRRKPGKYLTAIGVLILVLAPLAVAQISPGELSDAHRALSGPGRCTECHDAGKRPPEFKCEACHADIRGRIQANRGLHPSLVGNDRSGRACAQCHNEHNGRSFALIHWKMPLSKFDHASTGYRLEAKHAQLECRACHKPGNIPAVSRNSITIKDLNKTYLGLTQRCSGCHTDVHRGELSDQCDRCHDSQDWKKPVRFDHRNARFQLDGVHERIGCGKCHSIPAVNGKVLIYKNLKFEDCSPCHKDPHAGKVKGECRTCHSAKSSWAPVNVGARFDHSKTRYPLLGRHARVECIRCHLGANLALPITFEKCRDCHTGDPHRGQFDAERPQRDCVSCHTVNGFKPAAFGVAEHATCRFPLKEHHRTVPCADCHKPNSAKVVMYRMQSFSCNSCHRDIHEGQFADARYGNDCEKCHNQNAFTPSLFTASDHASTRFPLSGGHVKPDCAQCHKPGTKPVKFRLEDRSCTVCHASPHSGQFTVQMAAHSSDGTLKGCQSCHTVNSWQELMLFDHASTGFRLDGAHAGVTCRKCHKSIAGKTGASDVVYRDAPQQCTGCHQDPHAGQFAARIKISSSDGNVAGCSTCHSVNSWREVAFDHAATDFPLVEAHQSVKCDRCHTKPDPQSTVRYAKTPRECAACHEDIHEGQFAAAGANPDCGGCHRVLKWVPSTFNHGTQSTFALTGAHRNVACASCHAEARVVRGKKVVIFKGTARDCAACHGMDTSGKQP